MAEKKNDNTNTGAESQAQAGQAQTQPQGQIAPQSVPETQTQAPVQATAKAVEQSPQAGASGNSAASTQQAVPKKKKKIWKWVLFGCGGCFLCILLSVGAFVGVLGVITIYPGYKLARENISNENLLCQVNTESDLQDAYQDFTTDDYKDSSSYTDFRSIYQENEEFFDDCYAILPSKPKDFVGFSASTTSEGTTLSFSKETTGGKTMYIELVVDESGDVLLNDLTVED